MKDDRADARPVPVPPSVRELIRKVAPDPERRAPEKRTFSLDGTDWVARIAGEITAGSGAMGAAYIVVIRFEPAPGGEEEEGEAEARRRGGEERARSGRHHGVREALLPRGRFELLYDEELIELFVTSRAV